MLPAGHPRAETRTGPRVVPLKRHDIRLRRLESIYRETIQDSLRRRAGDARLADSIITITQVKMSEDMLTAEVGYTLLNTAERKSVHKALTGAAQYFLSEIAQKVQVRALPRIRFEYDAEHQDADDVVGLIDRLARTQPIPKPEPPVVPSPRTPDAEPGTQDPNTTP